MNIKITRYIKDEKDYTIIFYTGIKISLSEILKIREYLEENGVSEENRSLFIPFDQKKYLIYIAEIMFICGAGGNREFGDSIGTCLGFDIFLLGECSNRNYNPINVIDVSEIDGYLRDRENIKKEETKCIIPIVIIVLIIATALAAPIVVLFDLLNL